MRRFTPVASMPSTTAGWRPGASGRNVDTRTPVPRTAIAVSPSTTAWRASTMGGSPGRAATTAPVWWATNGRARSAGIDRSGRSVVGRKVTIGSYEDREAIKDLYTRFAEAADDDRFDDWAATFTPDGSMFSPSHPAGRVTGRDQLRAMVSGNAAYLREQGIV